MDKRAPGKSHRKGISHKQFFRLFPDERAAEAWFVRHRWADGVRCPRCGCESIQSGTKHASMPYRCRKSKLQGCGKFFSVKTGTFMEASKLGYQDWVFALFLVATNLKSVSSMKLHRDLAVTQRTAWHMAHRIRKALKSHGGDLFAGPVEVDETYMGGKRRNMSNAKRKELEGTGRGPVGKTAVVGAQDRATNQVAAKVVESTNAETLGGFVSDSVEWGATVYTDDASAYEPLPFEHETVKHSASEYVKGDVHTNGVESFWSMLKRAHKGTFHKISAKHLHRYVDEFAGRHNIRDFDTLAQMGIIAAGMEDSQLRYKDLVA